MRVFGQFVEFSSADIMAVDTFQISKRRRVSVLNFNQLCYNTIIQFNCSIEI